MVNTHLELVCLGVEVTCPKHGGFLTLCVAQLHRDSVADPFDKLEKGGQTISGNVFYLYINIPSNSNFFIQVLLCEFCTLLKQIQQNKLMTLLIVCVSGCFFCNLDSKGYLKRGLMRYGGKKINCGCNCRERFTLPVKTTT